MKKLYVLSVAFLLCCIAITNAQTRYWVGGSSSNWNDGNNWATSSVGPGGAGVPPSGADVIIDRNASINVNTSPISLNTLSILNNSTVVKLYTSATTSIGITGTGTSNNQGLRIVSGARLEDSCAANVVFSVDFAAGSTGLIDGTWYFAGISTVTGGNGPTFNLPGTSGQGNSINVNGTIIIRPQAWPTATTLAAAPYLKFNSGSLFWLDRDAAFSPRATWDPNSTISITGSSNFLPNINVPSGSGSIGNLVLNAPGINDDMGWNLPNNLLVAGNLQILNTNGFKVSLGTDVGSFPIVYTVNGNFSVTNGAYVILGSTAPQSDMDYSLQVNGDFNLSGGTFELRGPVLNNPTPPTPPTPINLTKPTFLKVKGNFNYTGGSFACSNASTSTTIDLFGVELNGTSTQNVTAYTGTIDNTNHMITLRLNNGPAGAALTSPLAVGKISWKNSAAGGILTTTSTNLLTINNTNETDATVVNTPADNGFVSGPVKRITSSNGVYYFPTGKANKLRYVEVRPTVAGAGSYTAEYFNTAYPTLTVLNPLTGVSNQEYWIVSQVTGSGAAVRLNLASAVPGAQASDALVVARFNGTNWVSEKGTTGGSIQPGNTTSGNVFSQDIASFSPFTFGIMPGSPLPIYLLSFTAKKVNNNTAKLNWSITSNSNPDHFEILRSTDGSHFSQIGTTSGAGLQLDYEFTDNDLPLSTTYYRLRMIDKTGVITLSKIVTVVNGAEGILITSMLPTLVTGQAKLNIISSDRANIRLVITDMYGRIVKQQAAGIAVGSQDIWLNLSSLAAGAYQVTGYLDNGKRTATIRFVKK